ncbi:MAG: hypothetical protein IT186_04070 [Acidobacteria bacterium]|nr:hypothetical protein [Acidobacteriota bacterium]
MRRLRLVAGTPLAQLDQVSLSGEAFELDLAGAPRAVTRLDLLLTLARATAPFVVHFSGTLKTPLVEVAALASGAEWTPGAVLDLRRALLAPLLWSAGERELRAAVLVHGSRVPADALLRRRVGTTHSARALHVLLDLLDAGRGGAAESAFARELAAFRFVMTLPDREEGVRAFLEKRQARFDW